MLLIVHSFGGVRIWLVVYQRPFCLSIFMVATVWPSFPLKVMIPVPFLCPVCVNESMIGLSDMYLSGARMVPEDLGVYRISHVMIFPWLSIILIFPVPIA